MSSILVAMSYLFCEIDCGIDMWQNHFANIIKGLLVNLHIIIYYNFFKRIIHMSLIFHAIFKIVSIALS